MKNLHLVPANVIDLTDKIGDTNIRENERNNYVLRLEAIRDYTTMCLNTYSRDRNSFMNKQDRSKMNYSRVGRNNV
jgi:hypothetical protein